MIINTLISAAPVASWLPIRCSVVVHCSLESAGCLYCQVTRLYCIVDLVHTSCLYCV